MQLENLERGVRPAMVWQNQKMARAREKKNAYFYLFKSEVNIFGKDEQQQLFSFFTLQLEMPHSGFGAPAILLSQKTQVWAGRFFFKYFINQIYIFLKIFHIS